MLLYYSNPPLQSRGGFVIFVGMSEHMMKRPLSPHLQVYRLPVTALVSITHRLTGLALAVGTLMVLWWLLAAASGLEAYNTAMAFARSPLGIFLLAGWSFAVYFHLLNGIRHLVWDTGRMFGISCATQSAYMAVFIALFLTILTWVCVYVF